MTLHRLFGGPLLVECERLRSPGILMAAAVLFTLPTVLLFLLAQRTFLRGIATTGLKG